MLFLLFRLSSGAAAQIVGDLRFTAEALATARLSTEGLVSAALTQESLR